MTVRATLLISLLALVSLMLIAPPSAFACMPDGDEPCSQCVIMRRRPSPPVRAAASAALTPVPIPVVASPRGDSPSTAMEIPDAWQTLEPGASFWYRLGDGNLPQRLEVWLDANGQGGIGFAVFAPDQMGDFSGSTVPKGRGTYNRSEPSHDLYWVGQANAGGTWFIAVTNSSAAPVSFKLAYNRAETPRSCRSYWEYIGKDYVYWTACK